MTFNVQFLVSLFGFSSVSDFHPLASPERCSNKPMVIPNNQNNSQFLRWYISEYHPRMGFAMDLREIVKVWGLVCVELVASSIPPSW